MTNAQRKLVLDYLQLLDVVCEISYNPTPTEWLQKYEDLYNSNGKVDYSFSANGTAYIFRLHANVVTKTLFYDILDYTGNFVQAFNRLVEYPNNLLITSEFRGIGLYFFENKVYLDTNTEA